MHKAKLMLCVLADVCRALLWGSDWECEAGEDMVTKRDACRILMGKPDKNFFGSASLN